MRSQSITELNNTSSLRYAIAIVSAICVWAALPTTEASAQACFPDCRTGYTCHQGECVSVCNPACGDGEVCNAAGACIAVAPTPTAMPEPAVQLDDSTKPRIAAPATFVALGGFLLVAGGVTFATSEYDFGYWTGGHYAGVGLMTMGAISLIAATPFLAIRTHEKREWKRNVSSRNVKTLSLAPSVSPSGPSKEYGLTLRGNF